jgi:hypothetical protein
MTRFACGGLVAGIGAAMLLFACISFCLWQGIAEQTVAQSQYDQLTTELTGAAMMLAPCIGGMVTVGAAAGIAYWGASARAKEGYEILTRDWGAAVLLAVGSLFIFACSPLFVFSVMVPTPSVSEGESFVTAAMFLLPVLFAGGAILLGLVILLLSSRRASPKPAAPQDAF